ncbi:preprotein translocase, SecE subunit [Actinomyces sp. Chiba101]|uniref:Protein translocase subunit SecE n=2 Tax=Actinomyces TaxID=1654 RepID=A0A8H9LGB3_9ACTO|nr:MULTISPECIES: preprotein translocase subunit SecE [Actinomyces]ARD41283.1 preprotein translocase subunit SecE [Actinomyces gaoshouyii]SHI48106.1 preprotein translocase subunit SecE [Actinomyces denticolens]SUU09180.1 Preprotein translocase subunit secE [Actinomyces denticolens]BAW92431.1 preprotein translocase, SecE subunit [Actinomyces sp. Chiba101]GAV94623.1 preprotein translocase, SecE subunit [Actinomyces denticolens]
MSESAAKDASTRSGNPIKRVMRFIRQVIDEMRKVIWPTKNELWTYFVVVVVFIVAIMAFTGILDTIFDRLVLWGLG